MNRKIYEYWFLRNEDISYGRKSRLLEYFYDSYNIYRATEKELIESRLMDPAKIESFIENRKNI